MAVRLVLILGLTAALSGCLGGSCDESRRFDEWDQPGIYAALPGHGPGIESPSVIHSLEGQSLPVETLRVDSVEWRPTNFSDVGLRFYIGWNNVTLDDGRAVPQWVPESEELTPIGALQFVAFLCALGALFALGLVVRRTRAFPRPWHVLPLAIAVAVFPLMVVSGFAAYALGNERLIEVAIVLFGAAWILLGVYLWRALLGLSRRP